MKNVNIIFLLFTSNVIVAMEAEHTSLASFFDLDKCTQHQDISKAIAQQYVSDKQWWYVDKEIQFDHQCCSDAPRWYVDEKNISKKNSFRRVLFNKNVTEIVAHPVHDLCYSICVWDRKSGIELERISHEDYKKAISSASYDKELWVNNRLYSMKYMCKLSVDDRSMLVQHASHDGTGAAFVMVQGPEISKVKVCGTDIESLCLVHDGFVRMAHFNPCNIGEIITASDDCTMRLWHSKTGQELLRVTYDTCVTSACFNEMGTEIVVATDQGLIQILMKYHTDKLQQILLNKLLHTWLVLKRPNKEINSVAKLLDNVAQLLRIDWRELLSVWASFPEHVQRAMWSSMSQKIQRYGK